MRSTTLVGFGSLMIASHQGLQSLGRVLTLGVTCCLFASLVMLPAALTWMTRNRKHALPADPRRAARNNRLADRADAPGRLASRLVFSAA